MKTAYEAIIIGGGPAGSSAATEFARRGWDVAVIERKSFPREVVCGEFLSYEVVRALKHFGIYDEFLSLGPTRITSFVYMPERGPDVRSHLGFEAWAMKRSLFDRLLLTRAQNCGATVIQPADVTDIHRDTQGFTVRLRMEEREFTLTTGTVIAAYGKQAQLDRRLNRDFARVRTGMTGIKYHVPRRMFKALPTDEIRLLASRNIYCGVNRVNDDEATLCFLAKSEGRHPNGPFEGLVRKNRGFREIFRGDDLSELRRLPKYGVGDIYFGPRRCVEDGVYMIGDAAGVIGPLAGDGIGMAIESGCLVAGVLSADRRDRVGKEETQRRYVRQWNKLFRKRLLTASWLQSIAMRPRWGNAGALVLDTFPMLAQTILRGTRNLNA